MKTSIHKFILATFTLLCLFNISYVLAVAPVVTDAGVKILCAGDINLPPIASPATYTVMHSETSNSINDATPVTLNSGNIIPTAKTGYYFIMTKQSTAACISDAQIIPVYVLKPLTVDFSGSDYCSENSSTTTFTGTATTTETGAGITLVYKWYTVVGTTETAIAGANNKDLIPTIKNTSTTDISTTYRLKAGYQIGSNIYCTAVKDIVIKTLAPATTPTITINSSTPDTW